MRFDATKIDLPVVAVLPEITAAFSTSRNAVLQAPPGAGKTTVVPPYLLFSPGFSGRILMLEPRRVAARAAAERMAALLGEDVGRTVGYRTRFDAVVSKETRIEVLTEGILARRLIREPDLPGVSLVVFDEFHERHWQADLTLALCLDIQRGLREDLSILVMSATLESERVSALMGGRIVKAEGRSWPVEIEYLSEDPKEWMEDAAARGVRSMLERTERDLLVFLPGGREIRRTRDLLSETLDTAIEILPLYGDLPRAEQDKALRPNRTGGRRRVILSTSLAETSLTIEGVDAVVDSGWMRVPRHDARTGMTRLETLRVSRASADQRAGRAGRLGPGRALRLWSRHTDSSLQPYTLPEILCVDLAPLLLDLASWGVSDPSRLSWLDAPPDPAVQSARDLLKLLGAFDARGGLNADGRRMADFPAHPRVAHMLLEAEKRRLGLPGCDLAAIMEERDLLRTTDGRRSVHFLERFEALRSLRGDRGARRIDGLDRPAAFRALEISKKWATKVKRETRDYDDEDVAALLATAYPDRICGRRAGAENSWIMANGRGARLAEGAEMRQDSWIVAASVDDRGAETIILAAAPIGLERIRRDFAERIERTERVTWNGATGAVDAVSEERLGALVLSSRPLPNPSGEAIAGALLAGLRAKGLAALPWTDELRGWQARVMTLRAAAPERDLPDVGDESLLARLEEWLLPFLSGVRSLDAAARMDLGSALGTLLTRKQAREVEEEAPTHIAVPSGSRVRIDYEIGKPPVLAVRLQEVFGLAETPRVAWGRVPVVMHLLSPARRPVQVTTDLRSFWNGTYAEVKKELRGRYPKHSWPDDPWNAPAVRGTGRKRRT